MRLNHQNFFIFNGGDKSVADFIAEIRRLASACKFGDYLDDALWDQFVCGLRSEGMHKRLLAETTLTLKQAVEIATGMEAAAKHARASKTLIQKQSKLCTQKIVSTAGRLIINQVAVDSRQFSVSQL